MDRIRYLNDLSRRCRPGISLIIGLLLALVAGTAAANGGAIILAETIGPYNIRVTADPYPLQVGVNDISVLLGRLADAQIILDADVTITAQPLDAPGEAATFPANHDLATDDRYYASNTVFSAAGPWKLIVAVDGPGRVATFEVKRPDAAAERVKVPFDLLHVTPPQTAPDFIRVSPLADAAGWVDVDQKTLRHKTYPNIWSLGDAMNAPNAKTAAAARKQAPVVAANVVADLRGEPWRAVYDGYGSCPLTVERGKIVLAEFGYGGKLLPSLPRWILDGTRPTRLAWLLKESILPPLYWQGMLRGREWLAQPVIGES